MRRRDFLAVLPALTFGAGACSAPPPLRVAAHAFPGYEFLYLARRLDAFQGAPIHLVESPSATASSRALLHGLVEAAALTLDEVLALRARGLPLVVVLVFNASAGADQVVVRPPLQRLADLAGRRVGVEIGAVGALMLDAALEKAGLESRDVRVLSLSADRHLTAWRDGEVDALVTFDPMAATLRGEGARLVFDSRAIPDRILDVLAVREDALVAQGNNLRMLIAGHFRAVGHYALHAEEAARMMAPRAMAPALFNGLHLHSLADNFRLLGTKRPYLNTLAGELADLLHRRQIIQARPETDSIARADYLPSS